jgi:hypothetical protein
MQLTEKQKTKGEVMKKPNRNLKLLLAPAAAMVLGLLMPLVARAYDPGACDGCHYMCQVHHDQCVQSCHGDQNCINSCDPSSCYASCSAPGGPCAP